MKWIKSTLKKSKLILSLYHSFTADFFPSLNLYSIEQPTKRLGLAIHPVLNPLEKIFDNLRTNFWTTIAKRSKRTRVGYKAWTELNGYPGEIEGLFTNGYIIIENVLGPEQYLTFQDYCKDAMLLMDAGGNITEEYRTIDFEPLAKSLQNVTDVILESGLDARLQLSHIKSLDGSDVHMPGFNTWHCDRFIPYLKAMYFPFGCDWMPFERVKIAPSEFSKIWSLKKQKIHYFTLPDEFKEIPVHKFYLKPNSVVLGFNNILHRRSPIESPGERTVVYMDWTKSYTYKTILKELFK